MENKNSKRNGIKVKLISSLCMLLIASLMVVGSGYAWIVISTAPEVADIPIIVGANGALEIKLNIEEDASDRNSQFRNIVEFGQRGYDRSVNDYGLSDIVLLPAILKDSFADGYLQIPQYGYDGLVAGALETALVGTLGEGDDFFQSEELGVRAIGTSTGVTERVAMFNSSIKAARSAISSAKSKAQNSLKNDRFQSIVIKMVTISDATYATEDVDALGTMISGLEGSVAQLEEAYKQLIFASAASDNGQDDIVSSLVKDSWGSDSLTLEAIASTGNIAIGEYSVAVDSAVLAGIEALQTTKENVKAARDTYDNLDRTDDTFTSGEVNPILTALVNKDEILVNGNDPSSIDIADVMVNGATVTMQEGAGVYVEIADQVGDYSVSISTTVTMATKTSVANPYLTYALGEVEEVGAPGVDNTSLAMTNFYGYIIDLCFKTNAANSNLLLQTDAIDRVDDSNSTTDTMGGGSFMQLTIVEDATITDEQVKAIMRCFNIVFFDTDTNEILGYGELEVDSASTDTEGKTVTASISMGLTGNEIAELPQNDVRNISVLVCIDAEELMNEHVSATTAMSVKGILNLQFASDAGLVAMPYEQ